MGINSRGNRFTCQVNNCRFPIANADLKISGNEQVRKIGSWQSEIGNVLNSELFPQPQFQPVHFAVVSFVIIPGEMEKTVQ